MIEFQLLETSAPQSDIQTFGIYMWELLTEDSAVKPTFLYEITNTEQEVCNQIPK